MFLFFNLLHCFYLLRVSYCISGKKRMHNFFISYVIICIHCQYCQWRLFSCIVDNHIFFIFLYLYFFKFFVTIKIACDMMNIFKKKVIVCTLTAFSNCVMVGNFKRVKIYKIKRKKELIPF